MFRIASFNTNSIRSRVDIVMSWLGKEQPDVLCLQETKVEDKDFPREAFAGAGYNVVFNGRKSYNGVAIASRHAIDSVSTDSVAVAEPGEGRIIVATIKGVSVVNTYIPQGQSPDSEKFIYKLDWIKGLRDYFQERFSREDDLVWVGDFNVAPEPIDVHNPKRLYGHVGYHPEEHKALQHVKEWGFEDIFRRHQQEGGLYTFWDYRVKDGVNRNLGWRVDHIWATRPLAGKSLRAWIDKEPRLKERPSDHTFIVAEFDL
ncbi:MAG: exodeoxyribonuclease III [Peptococcaceae bacterium BRH_c4b]|nr:MAG: exodeoxyribonuclease III [Peptococcaceae bacterium BRH_c4b]